jgi:peptidoglycan/LPS O-acetylase OafA/YrhL
VPFAKAGPLAVSFFYVLSGAVLTWGCTRDDGLPSSTERSFWGRRAARVLPAYLLALALAVLPFAAEVMKLHPGTGGVLRIAAGIMACGLLLQAFWPPVAAGLNTPGWSISCEAFFYALWPTLVGRLRILRTGFPWPHAFTFWAIGLATPLVGLALLRFGGVPAGPFATLTRDAGGGELLCRALSYFPPLRLPEFALGIVVGHALRATPQHSRVPAVDTLYELTLGCGLLACAFALGSDLPARLFGVPLATRIAVEGGALSPLWALWVWQLARGRGLAARLLSRPALQSLGEASYAIYVLQDPVVVWTTATLKRSAPSLIVRWNVVFWMYFAFLIVLSLAVHRLVETPLRARWTAPSRQRGTARSA